LRRLVITGPVAFSCLWSSLVVKKLQAPVNLRRQDGKFLNTTQFDHQADVPHLSQTFLYCQRRATRGFTIALLKPNKNRIGNGFASFGTRLVMRMRVSEAMRCIAKSSVEEKVVMKAVTTKMIVSLTGILLVAPFFIVALIVGARAVSLSRGAQDDLLLVALALGGAAASIFNGMGRRTAREKDVASNHLDVTSNARRRGSSMIHLGY
jgi:hypothetical protein